MDLERFKQMCQDGKIIDEERFKRDLEISNGKYTTNVILTFYYPAKEHMFAIEYYELPFDQDLMRTDIDNHYIWCINALKYEPIYINNTTDVLTKFKTIDNYLKYLIKYKEIKPISMKNLHKYIVKEKIKK